MKEQKLIDLTRTTDSLFIRIRVNQYYNYMIIYEFKSNHNIWQVRKISIERNNFRKFYFSFNFFKKNYEFISKNLKNATNSRQNKIVPIDSNNHNITWDSIDHILRKLNLLQLKSQIEVDSFSFDISPPDIYFIEISTPYLYKYIYWENPENSSKSFDADAIQELYNMILTRTSDKNSKVVRYKKNKWPNK